MLGMLLNGTFGANGLSAGLAVAVDFVTNALLAAGNSLHGGISSKGVLKGDLLVRGRHHHLLVRARASRPKILLAVNAMNSRILVSLASITLDHPVDVTIVGPG